MISITKKYRFESAHHLPYYDGACNRIHGHSYKVEVTLVGEKQTEGNQKGMLFDFKKLKEILKTEIGKYDHENLNDFFENPTAENMAERMFWDISQYFVNSNNIKVESVRLWETEDSFVIYRGE